MKAGYRIERGCFLVTNIKHFVNVYNYSLQNLYCEYMLFNKDNDVNCIGCWKLKTIK